MKLYSTGVRIPADKRDIFNQKYESALLQFNVRACFGPADLSNRCPIKLAHFSQETTGDNARVLDLRIARKLLREASRIFSHENSSLNEKVEVITVFDDGSPQIGSREIKAPSQKPITIPELIVLDGPSTLSSPDQSSTLKSDISVEHLPEDDSFSRLNIDQNNESDVQILTVKLNNSQNKRKHDDMVTFLAVGQTYQKQKSCQNQARHFGDLSNISTGSDVIVLSSSVKRSKKSKKVSRNGIKTTNLQDWSNSTLSARSSTPVSITPEKIFTGKRCTPTGTKGKKLIRKSTISQNSSDPAIILSSESSYSSRNILKRNNVKACEKGHNLRKKQLPGTSAASNYYESLNSAVKKFNKSPLRSRLFLNPVSPKRKSFLPRAGWKASTSRKALKQRNGLTAQAGLPKNFTSAKHARSPAKARRKPSAPGSSSAAHTNILNPHPLELDAEGLRPIVVDGCNVAYGHGQQIKGGKFFSSEGIRICVEFFHRRGHREIKVFLPMHFEESHLSSMKDSLQAMCEIISTPSRLVEGVRRTPYDDRFIVQYAAEVGGVIVSRDLYRDLKEENTWWKTVIDSRLLVPTFVGNVLMFPIDPLGSSGPTLDQLLSF